jgi:predicted RNA binding protein YcfA (HicA-like mRNA interferase family)
LTYAILRNIIIIEGEQSGMTGMELKQDLVRKGCTIIHGKKHDIAKHPARPGVKAPIPRHKGDIPKGTLSAIYRELGLK